MVPDQEARFARGKHQTSTPIKKKVFLFSSSIPCRSWGFVSLLEYPPFFHAVILVLLWERAGGVGSSLSGLAMEEFVMGDHARLVASMRHALELAVSSRLFAKLYSLFDSDATFRDALASVRGGSDAKRLRVVAYGLGGVQYSWAPRIRLALLLLLRVAFPDAIGDVELVCPTIAPVARWAMEELGCVVTASIQQCRQVCGPTLIFMPYADHVFFKNLLTLNWSADQLGKIVLLGHSFGTMVKMLELSISKQEKFGVTEQREKVRKLLAIKEYVNEFELCSELDGFWGDDCPYDELANESDDSQEQCGCMHCVANVERYAMISALPSSFSVHLFHFDPEIGMDHLVPGCSST